MACRAILRSMQVSAPELPSTPRIRETRTRLIIIVLALTLALVSLAVAAFWNHYKIGLFSEYRAGYASVVPEAAPGATFTFDPCLSAMHNVFPHQPVDGVWPEDVTAYFTGCSDRLRGLTADPWRLHNYLRL